MLAFNQRQVERFLTSTVVGMKKRWAQLHSTEAPGLQEPYSCLD